ncbi:MAG: heme exporter protein CcmB [Pseudomonadota bacterium]
MSAFLAVLKRELRLALRRPGQLVNPLVFFAVVLVLFPLGLDPGEELLRRIAPGVVWVAALLAMLLSQETLFQADFDDGSLEQMALQPQPLWWLALAKVLAHWLLTGLPLVLVSPLGAGAFFVPASAVPIVMLALLLGTAILSLLGGVGAALTVGLHRGGVLIAILIVPLLVPTLLLGTRAIEQAMIGLSPEGVLLWLAALLAFLACVTPFAIGAALRIHLD